MTPEELAEVEERMNRVYTEEIRQDGLALVAEVRRLTQACYDWRGLHDEQAANAVSLLSRACAAEAEVARLREALDAAQRIVRRKADRERGFEDCRACEALGYMGSVLRCAEHRATKSEGA